MLVSTLLLGALCAAFELRSIPLPGPDAHAFAVPVEVGGAADLLVLDAGMLTLYRGGDPTQMRVIPLCAEASAVDIADIHGGGQREALVLCGDRVLHYPLTGEEAPEGVVLFELPTRFSPHEGPPFLHVLVVRREGAPMFALPGEERLELRTPAGVLVESYPLDREAPVHLRYGHPFTVRVVDPPHVAPPGGMELQVSSAATVMPDLPGDLLPGEAHGVVSRRGTPRQLVEAAAQPPEAWPWFPLRTARTGQGRVLYAAGSPTLDETLVRVRRTRVGVGASPDTVEVGPPRRYPGMLLPEQEALPDFNGDGFVDLLLWKSAEPSLTLGTLGRAAVSGTWPIWLTVHLFDTQTGRFEARPAARVRMDAEIRWFLESPGAPPLRHIVLADLTGNGATDLACATAADTYAVWLYHEDGFRSTPDFEQRFSEPISHVAFVADLSGDGGQDIALRTSNSLHILGLPR